MAARGELQADERVDGDRIRLDPAGQRVVGLTVLQSHHHPEFAEPLRALAPKAKVRLRSLSRLYLEAEDYTHLSMLHGRGAAQDIFVPALAFLDAAEAAP